MITEMGDVERRLGIMPVEELLAERHALVKRVARLRAAYGAWGTWDAQRKIILASIAQKLRAQALVNGERLTEAAIEDAAHADDAYAAFVQRCTEERAQMAVLEDQIEGITARLNRGQVIARYLSMEVSLTPR